MNKAEFLTALSSGLGKLPANEVEQSLAFYSEMIDDRMEDGMTEQEAVAALGSVTTIAAQITAEMPPVPRALAKANTGSRTLNIVLLVLFSPIWVPIVLALAITALAIYLSIWMVVVSLWLVVILLVLCGPLGIFCLVWCIGTGYPLTGVWTLGGGLVGCGLGLFAWFGVMAASKGLIQLTHSFANWVKSFFVKRRDKNYPDHPSMPGSEASSSLPLSYETPYGETSPSSIKMPSTSEGA